MDDNDAGVNGTRRRSPPLQISTVTGGGGGGYRYHNNHQFQAHEQEYHYHRDYDHEVDAGSSSRRAHNHSHDHYQQQLPSSISGANISSGIGSGIRSLPNLYNPAVYHQPNSQDSAAAGFADILSPLSYHHREQRPSTTTADGREGYEDSSPAHDDDDEDDDAELEAVTAGRVSSSGETSLRHRRQVKRTKRRKENPVLRSLKRTAGRAIDMIPEIEDFSQIDRYSRIIFPVSFFIFNVLYWLFYIF
jgi:hypothetical protein